MRWTPVSGRETQRSVNGIPEIIRATITMVAEIRPVDTNTYMNQRKPKQNLCSSIVDECLWAVLSTYIMLMFAVTMNTQCDANFRTLTVAPLYFQLDGLDRQAPCTSDHAATSGPMQWPEGTYRLNITTTSASAKCDYFVYCYVMMVSSRVWPSSKYIELVESNLELCWVNELTFINELLVILGSRIGLLYLCSILQACIGGYGPLTSIYTVIVWSWLYITSMSAQLRYSIAYRYKIDHLHDDTCLYLFIVPTNISCIVKILPVQLCPFHHCILVTYLRARYVLRKIYLPT